MRRTPEPLEDRGLASLHDAVFALMNARECHKAGAMLRAMFALGERSFSMHLAYALCLIHENEAGQASSLIDALRAEISSLDGSTKARLLSSLDSIADMLPGGGHDLSRTTQLRAEAERMLPKLRKNRR